MNDTRKRRQRRKREKSLSGFVSFHIVQQLNFFFLSHNFCHLLPQIFLVNIASVDNFSSLMFHIDKLNTLHCINSVSARCKNMMWGIFFLKEAKFYHKIAEWWNLKSFIFRKNIHRKKLSIAFDLNFLHQLIFCEQNFFLC